MPHRAHIDIKHGVLALAHESMQQRAIAGPIGLTPAIVNRIFRMHAATGTLVPGKSTGAPWNTTACQDNALSRMVQQDHFKVLGP